jgi:hypothetical protein
VVIAPLPSLPLPLHWADALRLMVAMGCLLLRSRTGRHAS